MSTPKKAAPIKYVIPQPIVNTAADINQKQLDNLIACCKQKLVNATKDREDGDTEHYIYECAIELVYGADVWEWINNPRAPT